MNVANGAFSVLPGDGEIHRLIIRDLLNDSGLSSLFELRRISRSFRDEIDFCVQNIWEKNCICLKQGQPNPEGTVVVGGLDTRVAFKNTTPVSLAASYLLAKVPPLSAGAPSAGALSAGALSAGAPSAGAPRVIRPCVIDPCVMQLMGSKPKSNSRTGSNSRNGQIFPNAELRIPSESPDRPIGEVLSAEWNWTLASIDLLNPAANP